jgi:signal transduction histidine kinase
VLRARRLEHGRVAVEVSDTGGGIGEVERARVFERFYRGNGRQKGFGLGLAIAAQSVRAIGGTIEIRENDDTGTTVEVQLPAEMEVE